MWLSGRRAVRPDRDYYRNVRRIRLRTSRSKPSLLIEIIAMAALIVIVFIGWRIFH